MSSSFLRQQPEQEYEDSCRRTSCVVIMQKKYKSLIWEIWHMAVTVGGTHCVKPNLFSICLGIVPVRIFKGCVQVRVSACGLPPHPVVTVTPPDKNISVPTRSICHLSALVFCYSSKHLLLSLWSFRSLYLPRYSDAQRCNPALSGIHGKIPVPLSEMCIYAGSLNESFKATRKGVNQDVQGLC